MRILGISGFSGSGKTTLIEQLLPILRGQGLQVAVLKHTHHAVDLDQPGKDSYRFREAGAAAVMLASHARWALLHENSPTEQSVSVEALAEYFALLHVDLLLAESWKQSDIDKLEVHRPELNHPFLWPQDPRILAVASPLPIELPLPWLPLQAPATIAQFICQNVLS